MKMRFLTNCMWLTGLLSALSATVCAQQAVDNVAAQKVIRRTTMVGAGPTNVLDTYLSAEHFTGTGVTFLSSVERTRTDRQWSTVVQHEANVSSNKDRSGSQHQLEGAYNLYWGRLHRWELLDDRLTLQAGAVGNLSAGFIYNTSNGNNPAQARAHLFIMPTGTAAYRFSLWGLPLTARYMLSLPLCGLTFSPDYGQSYYELFSLGHYDRNAVVTTFMSAPEWRHLLTVDAQLSRRLTLSVGYLGNIQQQKVNQLRQHVQTHRFLIGVTRRFSIIPHAL